MGRPIELLYEDEEANPARLRCRRRRSCSRSPKVDFPHRQPSAHGFDASPSGNWPTAPGKLIATNRIVSRKHPLPGDRWLAQRLSRECPPPASSRPPLAVWAVQGEAAGPRCFYLGAGLRDGDAPPVAAFKASAEKVGRQPRWARCSLRLDAKDYTQYFGQVARGAARRWLYTSVAGKRHTVPAAQPDAGVRPAQQPEPWSAPSGTVTSAEHRGDREGGRRLRDRRRLLDRDRLAREQENSSTPSRAAYKAEPDYSTERARLLRVDLCLQGPRWRRPSRPRPNKVREALRAG